MKIVTIVGARPQFIKAAVVSRAFKKEKGITEVIIHTGQHYDENMSEVFFHQLGIPVAQYNLGINNLSNAVMTARMIEKIDEVILDERPDCVLVYGDTNSTLAGAIAAKQNHIRLVHVEAGLRSFNMKMPEELNRILADRISDYLFCPTDTAVANLRKEGYDNFECRVILSGDVMYDAALYYAPLAEKESKILKTLSIDEEYILVTLHRSENVDNPETLKNIISALNELSSQYKIIFPLHPRTQARIAKNNIKLNFLPVDPVGYFDMIQLLVHCKLVMTDSGGLQKEAFFFKKHCVTLREQTEWTELVQHVFNITAGSDRNNILKAFNNIVNANSDFNLNLYGNGHAGELIVSTLLNS